jgi:hypothetical protein
MKRFVVGAMLGGMTCGVLRSSLTWALFQLPHRGLMIDFTAGLPATFAGIGGLIWGVLLALPVVGARASPLAALAGGVIAGLVVAVVGSYIETSAPLRQW